MKIGVFIFPLHFMDARDRSTSYWDSPRSAFLCSTPMRVYGADICEYFSYDDSPLVAGIQNRRLFWLFFLAQLLLQQFQFSFIAFDLIHEPISFHLLFAFERYVQDVVVMLLGAIYMLAAIVGVLENARTAMAHILPIEESLDGLGCTAFEHPKDQRIASRIYVGYLHLEPDSALVASLHQ